MRRKVFVNRSAWVPLGHWRRSSAPHLIQAFLNQGPDPHVMLLVVGIDLAIGSIDILDIQVHLIPRYNKRAKNVFQFEVCFLVSDHQTL